MVEAVAYIVEVDPLKDTFELLDVVPKEVNTALYRAINRTTTKGRTRVDRTIRKQINFPAKYLRPSEGRLVVGKKASSNSLSSEIVGRTRPTSLARFTKQAVGQKVRRQGHFGVNVSVKPGVARFIKDAFLIRLRAGKDGPASNLALAVRSESPPRGAHKPKLIGKNLWLLYGPSISQAMFSVRRNEGVATEVSPDIADDLVNEFNRLLDLKNV